MISLCSDKSAQIREIKRKNTTAGEMSDETNVEDILFWSFCWESIEIYHQPELNVSIELIYSMIQENAEENYRSNLVYISIIDL